MGQFYSYLWLSADGTPYYAGKGTGPRAFKHHPRKCGCSILRPLMDANILVFPMNSEAEAFDSERALIELFGRIDDGTGSLMNVSDGGEGLSKPSIEVRARLSIAISIANRKLAHFKKRRTKMLQGRFYAQKRWGAYERMEF